MMLAAQDLPSILELLAFLGIVSLARRLDSGMRAVFYAVAFLIAEGLWWFLYPFTPVAYVGPFFVVFAFVLFVELGAGRDDHGRSEFAEHDVRAEFQRRRSRCRKFSLLPMVAGLVLFLWGEVTHETVDIFVNHVPLAEMRGRSMIGPDGVTWWVILDLVIPAVLVIGGLLFGLLMYRCPACGRIPLRPVGGDQGPHLNPTECPSCGARLA